MRVSLGLPTHRVGDPTLISVDGLSRLCREAEAAGFDAVNVTEHPFPTVDWLESGGHHSLDPIVGLSVAAAATVDIALHTNLFIPTLRNPFLAAKAIASLDAVSGGRVILGVGTGYLAGEFHALGADFDTRADDLDASLAAMREAWTGDTVTGEDPAGRWRVAGNRSLPRPARPGGPPVWIGGNSRRAMRRAVDSAQAWCPFPAGGGVAAATRTARLRTPGDLAERLDDAARHAAGIGRTEPLDVAFVPEGLSMIGGRPLDVDHVLTSCSDLAAVGVTWVTVSFPDESIEAQVEAIRTFGSEAMPTIAALEPGFRVVADT